MIYFSKPLANADQIRDQLISALTGRCLEAHLFGSFARGEAHEGSDIDLIIVTQTSAPFTERWREYEDLLDIYPAIDMLIYLPQEFEKQLSSTVGFWADVKKDLVQIV